MGVNEASMVKPTFPVGFRSWTYIASLHRNIFIRIISLFLMSD
jgi:hypothetical protein